MHRINSPHDVVATGVVQVDAGAGVTLSVPVAPSEGGGGVSPDHPLLYMSGQRTVASTLLTGWAAAPTGVKISRQGSTVTLAIDVTRTSDLTGFAEVLPIPLGFRPITSGYIAPGKSATYNDGTTTHLAVDGWWDRTGTSSPLRFRDIVNRLTYQEGATATFKAGQRLTSVITWQTADAIPTSLPGTPA